MAQIDDGPHGSRTLHIGSIIIVNFIKYIVTSSLNPSYRIYNSIFQKYSQNLYFKIFNIFFEDIQTDQPTNKASLKDTFCHLKTISVDSLN